MGTEEKGHIDPEVQGIIKEPGLKVAPDVTLEQIEQTSATDLKGRLELPRDYFDSLSIDDRSAGTMFSVRSRLMQSGLRPRMALRDESVDDFVYEVAVRSMSGKPLINVPDRMDLGRFFNISFSGKLANEELRDVSGAIFSHGFKLLHGVSELRVNEEIPSDRLESVAVPVTRFLQVGADEIDLEKVIAAEDRNVLDRALDIYELDAGSIHAEHTPFYLGETDIVKVPEDLALVINPGIDERLGLHYPSLIIDSGFEGPVRVEALSGPGQVFDEVEFLVFRTK